MGAFAQKGRSLPTDGYVLETKHLAGSHEQADLGGGRQGTIGSPERVSIRATELGFWMNTQSDFVADHERGRFASGQRLSELDDVTIDCHLAGVSEHQV